MFGMRNIEKQCPGNVFGESIAGISIEMSQGIHAACMAFITQSFLNMIWELDINGRGERRVGKKWDISIENVIK